VGTQQLDKIVIPTPLIPSLLWNIHNSENHPSKTQLRAIFDKMFYGIMVQQHIDDVYAECYQCKIQANLPKPNTHHKVAKKSTIRDNTSMQTSFAEKNKKYFL
jgi:hypothetical protein